MLKLRPEIHPPLVDWINHRQEHPQGPHSLWRHLVSLAP